jgi:chaperonin cofactor prefoldin
MKIDNFAKSLIGVLLGVILGLSIADVAKEKIEVKLITLQKEIKSLKNETTSLKSKYTIVLEGIAIRDNHIVQLEIENNNLKLKENSLTKEVEKLKNELYKPSVWKSLFKF